MRKADITTTTYYYNNEYLVDITTTEEVAGTVDALYEAWLYKEEIGIKQYVFGVLSTDTSLEGFIEMVENNLDRYIEIYNEEFEED